MINMDSMNLLIILCGRLPKGKQYEAVKTYMAHHQGLILLSINNFVKNNILQKRFMENPEMQSVRILLEERMPENVILTKEKKEKPKKVIYNDDEVYTERVYTKLNEKLPISNVISNSNYTIIMNNKGEGVSKYKDIIINRFKQTEDFSQGIFFYVKNINAKRIWTINYANYLAKPDKYVVKFTGDKNLITRLDGSIESKEEVCISPNEPVELRNVSFTNFGNEDEILEVTSFLEPVISSKEQDYAHLAFNNLFLTFDFIADDGTIIVKRKERNKDKNDMYLAVNFYSQDETVGDIEFEIDKEKFNGRGNLGLPKLVETSSPFTSKIKLVIDPIVAIKRTLKIKPGDTKNLYLIITVSDNKETCLKQVEKFRNEENIKRTFMLSRAKVEAENRYFGLKGKQIDVYQRLLSYLLFNYPISKVRNKISKNDKLYLSNLWKYGISGDLPILLVKISNINDINGLIDIIKAYDYYRRKNINIDLIILNEEESSYENYTKDIIQKTLLDLGVFYMQNQRGGIFVLNNLNNNEVKFLEAMCRICINCHEGNLTAQLNDLEEEYLDSIKQAGKEPKKQMIINLLEENVKNNEVLNMQNLKYFNEYGGFSLNGKEYIIKINKNNRLPNVWSHIIANERFGSLVTDSYRRLYME